MRRSILCAFVLTVGINGMLTSLSWRGQQPQFRSGVQIVQVDAVVTDARGRFVDDLTAADFEVFEDGQRQAIQQLYLAVHRSDESAARPGGFADKQLADASAGVVRVPSAARVFLLVFDHEHMTAASFKRAQAAAESLLTEHFAAGDVGGFISIDSKEGRVTTNREEILVAVRSARPGPGSQSRLFELRSWPRFASESEAVRVTSGDAHVTKQVVDRAIAEEPEVCRKKDCSEDVLEKAQALTANVRASAQRTLLLLTSSVKGLSALDGRKSLVFFTDGFIIHESWADIRRLIGQAAVAGVTIYSVDTRGLERSGPNPLDAPNPSLITSGFPLEAIDASQDAMNSLGVDTGGIVIRNRNILGPALEQVAREAGTYYVLAYSPTNPQLDGSFRRIEVKVKRAGVTVRARRGYLATRMQPYIKAAAVPGPADRLRPNSAPSASAGKQGYGGQEAGHYGTPTKPTHVETMPEVGRHEATANAGREDLGAAREELAFPPLSAFDPTLLPRVESTAAEPFVRLSPDVRQRVEQLAARASGADLPPKGGSHEEMTLPRLGWDRYQAGDVEGARDFLSRAAAGPAPLWVWYALGQAEFALSHPREAAGAWERVRASEAAFEPVYFDLVDAYLQLGDETAAIRILREAERRWPDDPEVFNALGVVQVRRGAIDDAIESFGRAARVRPAEATAYFNLGKAFEIRYARSRRFSRFGYRWVGNENDRKAAIENYRRYLAIGGPLESSAREALQRLEWGK